MTNLIAPTLDSVPVEAFMTEIMACEAKYIIVTAETGSGKTTRIPWWFHRAGHRVLVTEPLIETVVGTSEYVAFLMGETFGEAVGCRTSQYRCDSPATSLLFCTDGLALVRELSDHNRFDILFIDELHEWNKNQSTLEAYAWKELVEESSRFKKVIVLSATIDAEALSRARGNAPIFRVPGRQFPIEDRQPAGNLHSDIVKLVRANFDVLVFQPGKAEIAETIARLTLSQVDAELIPFHGELTRAEKDLAYAEYRRPKVIVSTNALETGRTVLPSPGRNLAVVDSGMERRIELMVSVEVLVLGVIAKSRSMQRRGRTGRVGPGVYISYCPTEDRPDYPVPEILRTRLDQTVLRLAVAGYNAGELPFFHELDVQEIRAAKRVLRALGAISGDRHVTETGHEMARLPVSVRYARMIVEARRLGVVDDIVTIAAALEVGGLGDRSSKAWRNLVRSEVESDLIVQLLLWRACEGKSELQLEAMGINVPSYRRATEQRRKLTGSLISSGVELTSTGKRRDILRAGVSGMVDRIYRLNRGMYCHHEDIRQLGRESVLRGDMNKLVVGKPIGVTYRTLDGETATRDFLVMATRVEDLSSDERNRQEVERKRFARRIEKLHHRVYELSGLPVEARLLTDSMERAEQAMLRALGWFASFTSDQVDDLLSLAERVSKRLADNPEVFLYDLLQGRINRPDHIANLALQARVDELLARSANALQGVITPITTDNLVAEYRLRLYRAKANSAAAFAATDLRFDPTNYDVSGLFPGSDPLD